MSDFQEALHYMKHKRTLMSNPGLLLSDVYYSSSSTSVSDAEMSFNNGRYTISLNSLGFQGNSQFTIPISSMLSSIYMRLQLKPYTDASAGIVAGGIATPLGWGYAAIQNISWLLGSSNVSQLLLNGQSLLMVNGEQSETSEKKSDMLDLGGDIVSSIATSFGVGENLDAYIFLNFPWSRFGADTKLALDTTLMQTSITVNIQFWDYTHFITGTNAALYATGVGNSFNLSQVMLRQGELRDKALSLRDKLLVNKEMSYSYPFLHYQSFVPPDIVGVGGQAVPTVVLQSFINADLIGIIFGLVNVGNLTTSQANAATYNSGVFQNNPGILNPWQFEEMEDFQLLWNGQVLYNSPGKIYQLYNIHGQEGSSYYQYFPLITGTGIGNAVQGASYPVYPLRVDFGLHKNLSFEDHYQNVQRLQNQTLTVDFKAPYNSNFRLFCTYIYNGCATFSDGQSKIYFD